jgi:hypothetical protein
MTTFFPLPTAFERQDESSGSFIATNGVRRGWFSSPTNIVPSAFMVRLCVVSDGFAGRR